MALDPRLLGIAVLDTVFWIFLAAVISVFLLFLSDRLTPTWFHLRNIGDDPKATAVFGAGILIAIAIIVAGVIGSPA